MVEAATVADRLTLTVAEEEGIRRWSRSAAGGEPRLLSSRDGFFECPTLVKCFPRDLMNDAAAVDDRFNEATVGMLIVCDLFGVEDEAEII